ncbi:uncharacterized protein EV420DRAFT_1651136 [Desarmillaria tabescens]|uniref:Uncharacterized protein n=1 Tax=Armillaria tabescens TaxID=1929756 RepID=A0AA39JAJ2_ARMTA|nr:uncharacterized protein EV420DRAFT_1651136 [Desarmillaria tabescens]KAK0439073.1 hypothetical protein EV420DRAFT_1651136 [Desarmillaria tabescens]
MEETDTAPFSSADNDFEKIFQVMREPSSLEELIAVDRFGENRIVPSCMFIHTLNFLARANIGNAKILSADNGDSLLQVLDMTSEQFSTTPSNYMLKHFSPPHWFAFLMVWWGGTDMIISCVKSYSARMGLCFLLEAFEAGFSPGIIYFLTFIAYGVGLINGPKGLEAWQWLFIIESSLSRTLAVATYFFFPAYPVTATRLSVKE